MCQINFIGMIISVPFLALLCTQLPIGTISIKSGFRRPLKPALGSEGRQSHVDCCDRLGPHVIAGNNHMWIVVIV